MEGRLVALSKEAVPAAPRFRAVREKGSRGQSDRNKGGGVLPDITPDDTP